MGIQDFPVFLILMPAPVVDLIGNFKRLLRLRDSIGISLDLSPDNKRLIFGVQPVNFSFPVVAVLQILTLKSVLVNGGSLFFFLKNSATVSIYSLIVFTSDKRAALLFEHFGDGCAAGRNQDEKEEGG